MLCPSCNKGTLRVIVSFACNCGHYPLVCDDCCQHFAVACGEPYGEAKLPPEHPIQPHHGLNAARAADPVASNDELFRPFLTQFPTVENFKLLIADGDWNDGNDAASQQDDEDPNDNSSSN